MIGAEDLANRFTHHAPRHDGEVRFYEEMRSRAHETARFVDAVVPDSREKSLAITALEEAVMWANAGVARHGIQEGESPS